MVQTQARHEAKGALVQCTCSTYSHIQLRDMDIKADDEQKLLTFKMCCLRKPSGNYATIKKKNDEVRKPTDAKKTHYCMA